VASSKNLKWIIEVSVPTAGVWERASNKLELRTKM